MWKRSSIALLLVCMIILGQALGAASAARHSVLARKLAIAEVRRSDGAPSLGCSRDDDELCSDGSGCCPSDSICGAANSGCAEDMCCRRPEYGGRSSSSASDSGFCHCDGGDSGSGSDDSGSGSDDSGSGSDDSGSGSDDSGSGSDDSGSGSDDSGSGSGDDCNCNDYNPLTTMECSTLSKCSLAVEDGLNVRIDSSVNPGQKLSIDVTNACPGSSRPGGVQERRAGTVSGAVNFKVLVGLEVAQLNRAVQIRTTIRDFTKVISFQTGQFSYSESSKFSFESSDGGCGSDASERADDVFSVEIINNATNPLPSNATFAVTYGVQVRKNSASPAAQLLSMWSLVL